MNFFTCLLSMVILGGAVCLFVCVGDVVMDILYDNVPSYRRWFNKQLSGGIDYEEEDEDENYR